MSVPGGLSELKDADDEVRNLINQVRHDLESKVGTTFTIYEAVSFKIQVVAGLNFFIKIQIEVDLYIHVRIFRPLPHTETGPEVVSFQLNKSKDDEIEYF
ncbi:cystatin-A [Biomphalaria pfeifferi]|uniref:Cystatin-A n=1 Tax=Biomphalaria pfeifferi TaxID=112525 RepID=A0AAD8FI85_BIOPF|nr:cystatin-A [Biomphalaria pfeifferi]